MHDASSVRRIAEKFESLTPMMDERMRRHWAAAEARAYGWGGVEAVRAATGMSPHTIRKGLRELESRAKKTPMPNACVHRERDGSDARLRTTNWNLRSNGWSIL
jgi:hypothetical protein